eukprot:scaffold207505_cov25-Prasinocladus_malaysianus.AAC.1
MPLEVNQSMQRRIHWISRRLTPELREEVSLAGKEFPALRHQRLVYEVAAKDELTQLVNVLAAGPEGKGPAGPGGVMLHLRRDVALTCTHRIKCYAIFSLGCGSKDYKEAQDLLATHNTALKLLNGVSYLFSHGLLGMELDLKLNLSLQAKQQAKLFTRLQHRTMVNRIDTWPFVDIPKDCLACDCTICKSMHSVKRKNIWHSNR